VAKEAVRKKKDLTTEIAEKAPFAKPQGRLRAQRKKKGKEQKRATTKYTNHTKIKVK
jgi:hypothetical protein